MENEPTAASTLVEAIDRELRSKTRGHVAHEHVVIEHVRSTLAMYFAATPELRTTVSVVLKSAVIVITKQLVSDEGVRSMTEQRLISECLDRITAINIFDPMEPYSDRDLWWPRYRPTIPDWVTEAMAEAKAAADDAENGKAEYKVGSPARHHNEGRTQGLHEALGLFYKHMPVQPLRGSLEEAKAFDAKVQGHRLSKASISEQWDATYNSPIIVKK